MRYENLIVRIGPVVFFWLAKIFSRQIQPILLPVTVLFLVLLGVLLILAIVIVRKSKANIIRCTIPEASADPSRDIPFNEAFGLAVAAVTDSMNGPPYTHRQFRHVLRSGKWRRRRL